MKKHILFLSIFWLYIGHLSALDVSVTHAAFLAGDEPYVEFYLHFVGSTLHFDSTAKGLRAEVEVTYMMEREGRVVAGDKFSLGSPLFDRPRDFAHAHRIVLANGSYEVEFFFRDLLDTANQWSLRYPVVVDFGKDGVQGSDVRLLAGFSKDDAQTNLHRNGYFLEPLPFQYYHRKLQNLACYFELYGADHIEASDYVMVYGVMGYQPDLGWTYVKKGVKRLSAVPVNVLLANINIADLPSGNFLFNVEVIGRQGDTLFERTTPFMRSNPEQDLILIQKRREEGDQYLDSLSGDRLDYYLKAMIPIVSNSDVESINFLLTKGNDDHKRNFIYYHFSHHYPEDPAGSFQQYGQVAGAIDRMFEDGFGHGFEADRGRIYLKYGQPSNRIRVEDDQGAFPYEIWYYDILPLTNERDVRFLFYNPDYTSNRFVLLTGTSRNERQMRQWELELYRNAPGDITDNKVDATTIRDDYRRRARQLFTE